MKKLMLTCVVLSSVALAGCVYRPYGYRDGYYSGYYGSYYGDRYYGDRYYNRDRYYGDRYRYRDRYRDYDSDDR
jgi:hypothetical protein